MKFISDVVEGPAVYPVFEGVSVNDECQYLMDEGLFKGEAETAYFFPQMGGGSAVFVGLGKQEELTAERLRKSYFKAGKCMVASQLKTAQVLFDLNADLDETVLGEAIAEGLLQSAYVFDRFKSDAKKQTDIELSIVGASEKVIQGIKEAIDLCAGIYFTRDLVNAPANVLYPKTLASAAKKELEPLGVKVDIYKADAIKEIGMEAFLTVAQGSDRGPRLIVMRYEGNPESNDYLGFVGKGLTYDAGGLAIKPAPSMVDMFCDMGGSGTVLGALKSIARSKLKVNVIAVVAACENMINGSSYKNGDIIGSMSGKTIEIQNTDAEGRLTLADAVYYITHNLKVNKLVDLATLTGACVAAFGHEVTGAVTNDQDFLAQIVVASEEAGEVIWDMPALDYFRDMNKSKVADLKNTGGKLGGMITAGLFVGEFVKPGTPWIHLDIAGTAFSHEARGYIPEGASGTMVKTLYYLAMMEGEKQA